MGKIPPKNLPSESLSILPFLLVITQISLINFFFHNAYWSRGNFSYFYSHYPYPHVEHSKFLLRFMASEEGFSCLQSLLTCPKHHFHHVSPFPIIYYLKLKYTNMTLTDSFFFFHFLCVELIQLPSAKGKGMDFRITQTPFPSWLCHLCSVWTE